MPGLHLNGRICIEEERKGHKWIRKVRVEAHRYVVRTEYGLIA